MEDNFSSKGKLVKNIVENFYKNCRLSFPFGLKEELDNKLNFEIKIQDLGVYEYNSKYKYIQIYFEDIDKIRIIDMAYLPPNINELREEKLKRILDDGK